MGDLKTELSLQLIEHFGFFIWRFARQRAFLREIRMARLEPGDLKTMLDREQPVYIVDLRHPLDYLPDQHYAWRGLCRELGLESFADQVGENWFSTIGMEDRVDWARPHYERAFAGYTRKEAIAVIRKNGGWSVPFQDPAEVLQHPQSRLYASAFFERGGATARLPWRVNNQPQGTHRPAAAAPVGAHTKEVLAGLSSGSEP